MKKQIHFLKTAGDRRAIAVIENLSKLHPERVTVILLQDGRKTPTTWTGKTYVLADAEEERSDLEKGPEIIDPGRLVDLIFESETVVSW